MWGEAAARSALAPRLVPGTDPQCPVGVPEAVRGSGALVSQGRWPVNPVVCGRLTYFQFYQFSTAIAGP